MNREETLALYEQGKDAWNKWANEMLEEKKRLEEAGEWHGIYDSWYERAKANFSNYNAPQKFNNEIDFSDYIFPGRVLFSYATFKGIATFMRSQFNHKASFNNTIFNDLAMFSKSKFYNSVDFHNCKFKSRTTFCKTNFNSETKFRSAKFYCYTDFGQATFNEEVSFNSATFKQDATFGSTVFKSHALFSDTKFYQNSFWTTVIFKKLASFEKSIFVGAADFAAIRSEGGFWLEGTRFQNEVPLFIQSHFVEAPRLDNLIICPKPQIKSSPYKWQRYFWQEKTLAQITRYWRRRINFYIILPLLIFTFGPRNTVNEVKYRALKRIAIQAHDHESEQKFWAAEIRSRRHIKDCINPFKKGPASTVRYIISMLYGTLSDYGRSIVRPIGALLILICLMTGLHLTKSKTPLTYDQVFSAGYIAANKSFLYIGTDPTKRSIIKEKYTALYGANENQTPKIPKTILTTEFFQTLLSAIFIFLALLGIRNNFKMK